MRAAGTFQLRRASDQGLSRTDLLAVLAVLSLVSSMVVMTLSNHRRQVAKTLCMDNLKRISQAVLLYSEDHRKTLPASTERQPREIWWWYKEQVKGHLGLTGESSPQDRVFACPADRGYSDPLAFSQTARFDFNSYPFNGVTLPGAPNLAGWNTTAVRQPARSLLVMEWSAHAPLSWHASRTGRRNAPFYNNAESVMSFVDGHVAFTRIFYDGYNAAYTRDPIPGYDYQFSGN